MLALEVFFQGLLAIAEVGVFRDRCPLPWQPVAEEVVTAVLGGPLNRFQSSVEVQTESGLGWIGDYRDYNSESGLEFRTETTLVGSFINCRAQEL